MNIVVEPHPLSGSVQAISSKSMAHRILILAAATDGIVDIDCSTTSVDIDTTVMCLRAIGCNITRTKKGFRVRGLNYDRPLTETITTAPVLNCKESGSTFRFMLPVVAALGIPAVFVGAKRLAQRPIKPLWEILTHAGVTLEWDDSFPLHISGKLEHDTFEISGATSSQYITGLILAACIARRHVTIRVYPPFESRKYVDMTCEACRQFGVRVEITPVYEDDTEDPLYWIFEVSGENLTCPKAPLSVEADWSCTSFWLVASAIGKPIEVLGLNPHTTQGDRSILSCLSSFGARVEEDAHSVNVRARLLKGTKLPLGDIIDLAPPLACAAAFAWGNTTLTQASRLRLKESNRIMAITRTLSRMGAEISADEDNLYIHGRGRIEGGCEVVCENDHRIAMMAAICAAYAQKPCTLIGAECVSKSYPTFFEDFISLGGYIETKGA